MGCNGTWHNITNATCRVDLLTYSSEANHMWLPIPNADRMRWLISRFPPICCIQLVVSLFWLAEIETIKLSSKSYVECVHEQLL